MNDSYIIAFTQGSSGRFVKYLLFNLLTDSSDELQICPITNSTHKSDYQKYTGYSPIRDPEDTKNLGNSHPEIWNRFKFDDPLQDPNAPKIFATHRFPDFKLIKNRLGNDIKIIIVTVDQMSLPEVIVNDKLKNYYDILTGSAQDVPSRLHTIPELLRRYERFVRKRYPGFFVKEDIIQIGKGVAADAKSYIFYKNLANSGRVKLNNRVDEDFETRVLQYVNMPSDIDYPMDQILFLPYSDLPIYNDDGYIWLQRLEQFTGKKANKVTNDSYQQYINGRNALLKEYDL